MGLDAFVRCTCVRDGKAKAHPFPPRLAGDVTGEPTLIANPCTQQTVMRKRTRISSEAQGARVMPVW
jgi:hypothetical protein